MGTQKKGRNLDAKLLTKLTDGKSTGRKSQRSERTRRKKMQVRLKVGKVAKHSVCPLLLRGSGRLRPTLAKAASEQLSGLGRIEDCMPL